jgi:hypothetical protein
MATNNSVNIFYSEVDSKVQEILQRRKDIYGAKVRDSNAHNFLHKKMAWAEATAITKNPKRGAVLTTNTKGGIGTNSLYSGAKYTDQGRFIVKPHITSVKLTNEGHLGSLKKCEVSFAVYSLNDLDTVQAFFDIGSTISVKYGWNVPGDGSTPGSFSGIIYNFSYTVNPQGGFNCVSYGIGRGIVLASANITTGFPHDSTTTTQLGEQTLSSDLINKIRSDIETASKISKLQKSNDIYDGYGMLELDPTWGSDNKPKNIEKVNGQKVYYISLEKLIYLINNKVLSSFSISKRLKELNAASAAAGDYLNLNGAIATEKWPGFPYAMPLSNVEQAIKDTASNELAIKIVCDGTVTLGCVPPTNTGQLTYLVSGNPFEVVFPGYNKYINQSGTSTHNFEFTDYVESFKKGDLSKIMLNVNWLEKQFTEIGKETQDNEKSKNQTISKFLINIFNSISDNSGTRFNLSMVSNPKNEDEFYIVDVNYRNSKDVTAYEMTTVESRGICRSVSLTSKVPSATAAAAYTQGINSPNAISSKAAALLTGGTPVENKDDTTPEQQLAAAMNKMDSSQGPVPAVVSSMQSALKRVYEKTSGNVYNTEAKNAVIYPLDFSVTLDGIEGFVFGNVITTNYLPKVYKRENTDIAFTVTKVEHTIQNNDWTTTLSTVCRVTLPKSQTALTPVPPVGLNNSNQNTLDNNQNISSPRSQGAF